MVEKQQPKPKPPRSLSSCTTYGCKRKPSRMAVIKSIGKAERPFCTLCFNTLYDGGQVVSARTV